MPPHVPYRLRGLPSRLWLKCNWFLRLERPWGAVTFTWWDAWWMVIYVYGVPGGVINLSSTKLPRPWSPWESSPSRKNPHGRTGNRTQNLVISSQKLWPLDHEDGHVLCNVITAIYVLCLLHTFILLKQRDYTLYIRWNTKQFYRAIQNSVYLMIYSTKKHANIF
jgi:hypothetical protein